MTARTLFVTGTDTGVGKTTVACALIRLARARGLNVCGWKPVATGCEPGAGGLRNADALALQQAAGTDEPYALVNPCAYAPPVAPHLAAQQAGQGIRIAQLDAAHRALAARYDLIVAEGAGGWRVPLDEAWTLGAWVAEREWPTVLVVGMRLGCLNHALMSAEIIGAETRLAGWVASQLPPTMDLFGENLASLRGRLAVRYWGTVRNGAAELDDPAVAGEALAQLAAR